MKKIVMKHILLLGLLPMIGGVWAEEDPSASESGKTNHNLIITKQVESKEFLERAGNDFERLTKQDVVKLSRVTETESFAETYKRMTLVKQNAAEGNGLEFAISIINSLSPHDPPSIFPSAWTTANTCLWTPIELGIVDSEEAISAFISETKNTWNQLLLNRISTMQGIGNYDRFTVSDYCAWALVNMRLGELYSMQLHAIRESLGAEMSPWLQGAASKILNGESIENIPSVNEVDERRYTQIREAIKTMGSNDLWAFRSSLSIQEKLAFHDIILKIDAPTAALMEMCRTVRYLTIDPAFPADLSFVEVGAILTPEFLRQVESAMLLCANGSLRYYLGIESSDSGGGVAVTATVVDPDDIPSSVWLEREIAEDGSSFFALLLCAVKPNSKASVIRRIQTATDVEKLKQIDDYIKYQSAIEKVFNPSLIGGGLELDFYIRGEKAVSIIEK